MKQTRFRCVAMAVLAFGLPVAALADLPGTVALPANTALSLDTGATSSSGGDILWTGSQLSFVGSAKGGNLSTVGLSGAAAFASLTQLQLQSVSGFGSQSPILSAALTSGTILGVATNGKNLAKVLVTANGGSGGTLTLQYVTYGNTGTTPPPTGGPTVTSVVNGSSGIPPGFPNSGVAPSSLIAIIGTGLADPNAPLVLQDTMGGLPSTLNGASISLTVGTFTGHPAIYYTSPTAIGAVLPAGTPPGTGTITVTYNNATSAAAPIQVLANGPGLNSYYNGLGVATDATTGNLLTFANPGKPGEAIVIWGTGLGGDRTNNGSDTTYSTSVHTLNVPLQVFIGGVLVTASTNILFQGPSIYPGVDVIGMTIPSSVPTGCYVSFSAVIGNVVSNVVTLPISTSGGPCSDPALGIDGSKISTLTQGTVASGSVYVVQQTSPGTTSGTTQVNDVAAATFDQITGSVFAGGSTVSIGGCSLSQTVSGAVSGSVVGLDAGTITVTPPGSTTPVPLSSAPGLAGAYFGLLPSGAIPSSGGTFTFNGSGGSVVGQFKATVDFPSPINWTNQGDAATVNRSGRLTVNWTGGAPGSYVVISGASNGSGVSGRYSCIAPQSAGSFTVPTYVLLGLPAGTGTTSVENSSTIGSFTATGINVGTTFGAVSVSVNSNYQ